MLNFPGLPLTHKAQRIHTLTTKEDSRMPPQQYYLNTCDDDFNGSFVIIITFLF